MDDPGKTCDVCGERQLSANGWIRYRDIIKLEFVVLRKKSQTRNLSDYKDACGHTCTIRALNSWLVAVHVNAPAEVKKDEN